MGDQRMCEAAAAEDRERVGALLAEGVPVDACDASGRTPLMIAARLGCHPLVRILLDAGADANARQPGAPGRGLGSRAARAIAASEEAGDELRTPLSSAIESGEVLAVEMLLTSGARPQAAGATSPLDLALLQGDPEIVRLLLDHGADPNDRDAEGDTPLMIAAAGGGTECIAALLESGAIYSARNDDGETALGVAARAGRVEAVEALAPYYSWWERRRARARVRRAPGGAGQARDSQILRLHEAAQAGRLSEVRKLVACGTPPDAARAGGAGDTALALAAQSGHLAVMKALLQAGADPNARARGDTPLIIAIGPRSLDPSARADAVRLLVAGGASPEERDADGLTPLMRAVMDGRADTGVVAALVEMGADVEAEHPSGLTALEIAAQDPNKAVVVDLLERLSAKRETELIGVPAAPVAAQRGVGRFDVSEVVLCVRASIDDVARAFEAHRGGRSWRRDVYGRDGLHVGDEGVVVYQLRDHEWTLAQTALLDATALRERDARVLSEELDTDALFYEVCEGDDLLSYQLYRGGECVETLRVAADVEARLRSSLRNPAPPGDASHARAWIQESFAEWELFVPGVGDNTLGRLAERFAPADFERVDFVRVGS